MFLRIFKHLLPNARAWKLTPDKFLRTFFVALGNSSITIGVKTFFDETFNDIDPQQTRELEAWENQWSLRSTGMTEQARRDRLEVTWKALGGQDTKYIQDTLRDNGFDVYVHEWWAPGSEPGVGVKSCVTPRNPLLVLRRDSSGVNYLIECGEALAECGEALAECGERLTPPGYPLVNKVFTTERDIITLCGEALAECGEVNAACGNYITFRIALREYVIPLDATKWSYFIYIGGQTFGDLAQVDPKRKDEFEALCLKICPTQLWLGIIVEYV